MKYLKTTLTLLIGAFMFLSLQPVQAITSTTATSAIQVEQQKNELKKSFKAEKKLTKFQNLLKKSGVDFKDPVEKFLWFGILGLGVGFLLGILNWVAGIAFMGWFAYLFWVAGVVCIVLWLVKKFAS